MYQVTYYVSKWYLVNTQTGDIHSSWEDRLQAVLAMKDLNRMTKGA